MGDFDFSGQPQGDDRYSRARRGQGFEKPVDRSPFPNPDGWKNGHVKQTGGMVMVREWDFEHGQGVRYQAGYGENNSVGINRSKWNPELGYYEHDGVVVTRSAPQNTDRAKARVAKQLMEEFNRGKHR